jgi:hypothetical protein
MIEQEFGEQQIRKQQPENRAQGAIAGADPWVNRSGGMRCRTCIWFVSKVTDRPTKPEVQIVGRCRRHAPTMGGYPVVYQNDWCGDHRIDENKF